MKLLSCKVDGFGCLSDRNFDFSSNPSCVFSENGSGKTTLTVFIKSMFYGIDKTDRKNYAPWGGGVFGGTLEFSSSNGEFRIERYFGKKASDDKFRLTDTATGLESFAYGENVGVELFGIDAESYAKSTFMPQGNKDFSATTSITTKLGELIEASDDAKSFDGAVSLLEDYMRNLKLFRGRGGLIDDLDDEKFEIEKKITDLEAKRATIGEKKETRKNYEDELVENAAKLQKLEEKRAKIADGKVLLANLNFYENLKKAAEQKEVDYENARAAFGESVPTDAEIEEVFDAAREVEREKSYKNTDLSELEEIKGHLGDFSTASAAAKKIRKNLENPKKPSPVAYISAVAGALALAAAVGAIVGFTALFFGIAAASVAVAAALAFLFYAKNAKKSAEKQKEAAFHELASFGYDPSTVGLDRFDDTLSRYGYLLNIEKSAKNEILENEQKIARLNAKINAFIEKYGAVRSDDTASDLKKISDAVRKLPDLKEKADEASDACEKFAKEHGITENTPKPDLSDDPAVEIEALSRRSAMLNSLKGSLDAEIGNLEAKVEELPDLRRDAERLASEIEENKEKRADAETALELLREAKTSLGKKYLGKTKSNFGEVLEELTGKNSEFDIDTNFALSFKEAGGYRGSGLYSAGMQSIFAVCMRIALAKSIFEGEEAFLILDDPFTDLDDEKLERAKGFIRKLAENYQIIYTTCHESRKI